MLVAMIVMYFPTLIFLKTGIVMKNHYSEFPDTFSGYHLSFAVKNKETWEESNQYAGRVCIWSSLCLLVIESVFACCYIFLRSLLPESYWLIPLFIIIFGGVIIQLVLLFILPYRHLKRIFGDGEEPK